MQNNERLIIQKVTGLSKSQLFLNPEIDSKSQKDINLLLKRYQNGEPIEYIINNAEFYSLDFFVDQNVLIPKNDTEVMVDKAIETIISFNNVTLIDVWTGSGCIVISIIKNTEKIKNCYAVDISRKVLEVTQKNLIKHSLEKKIYCIKSDLLKKLIWNKDFQINSNLIITANLPYIKTWDHKNMDKETVKYEPDLALYWWKETGFELYEQLIKECKLLKKLNNIKKLILFIEIGFDQAEYSKEYLNNKELSFSIYKDNSWVNRCIKIEI